MCQERERPREKEKKEEKGGREDQTEKLRNFKEERERKKK